MIVFQAAISTLLLALSPKAAAQSFMKYTNERYGFSISLPSDFKMDPPPENGDGRRFQKDDGCSIAVFGSNNVLEQTLDNRLESARGEFDEVTYQSKGKNWYVLSGYKGSDILYIKAFVGSGSINEMWVQYPRNVASECKEIVTRVSTSFRPGKLNESH